MPSSPSTTVSTNSATISSLTNGTTYYVWVKAKNANGSSNVSTVVSGKPLATPSAPTVTAGAGQLGVSWSTSTGADQYEVYYGIGTATTLATTVSTTSATITGLSNGTTYAVRIRGKNSTGVSSYGTATNAKPIANIGTITLTSGTSQIALSWTAVAGADSYEVYYSASSTMPSSPSTTVSTNSATISSLTNGTTYYAWVKAKNAKGSSAVSTVVSGKPLATPSAPTVTEGRGQLSVSWSSSVGATQYEVYYGIGTATTLFTTVSDTSTTITGLTGGTTYAVRIRGKNSTGVSGYSDNGSGTTLGVIVTTLAGSGISGYANGTGTAAQFSNPEGVAVDGTGNVYVADTQNHCIRKISPSGVVTTFAGGTQGYADGTGTAAKFDMPLGLAIDSAGNLYVVDNRCRIRKISPSGVVMTFAGSETLGYADGTGTAAQFGWPRDVAVDNAGNVYVADTSNSRIRKISPTGVVTTLAGSGVVGYADGAGTAAQFAYPYGVAVDSAGNVYVSDYNNNRIRKISPTGVVTTLAGNGTSGASDGTGANAKFNGPYGVAVDSTGNVYVTDNGRCIRKISPAGVVTTLAGGSTSGYTDGTATVARFNVPSGIAVTSAGVVYVSDSNNHCIRKIE
jgi:streptogramin lyase